MKSLTLCIVIQLLSCCLSSEWIDPFDMGNFDHETKTMRKKDGEEPIEHVTTAAVDEKPDSTTTLRPNTIGIEKTCTWDKSPCTPHFKRYVRLLLYHLREKVLFGAQDINLRVKLTSIDVEYLEAYVDKESNEKDFHYVYDILGSMVKHASTVTESDPSVNRLWLETVLGMTIEKFLAFGCLAVLAVLCMFIIMHFNFSMWKVTAKLTFFLFVISVFWQWFELFKIEEAKQHMVMMKDMPESCKIHKKKSFMSSVFHTFTSPFMFENNECLHYYEHLLIVPFWRVTPTQALSKTVIRFFLDPLKDVGEAIKQFLTSLLHGLPVQLWPIVLGSIGFFFVLILFMYFKYKVSLPFGILTIEPARNDNIMKEQLEKLKASEEAQRLQIQQLLDDFKSERLAIKDIAKAIQENGRLLPVERRMVSTVNSIDSIGGGDYARNPHYPLSLQQVERSEMQDNEATSLKTKYCVEEQITESFENISVSNIEHEYSDINIASDH